MRTSWMLLVLFSFLALAGCAEEESASGDQLVAAEDRVKSDDKADSSAEAVFLNFEFDAEMLTSSSWNPSSQIEDQLLYTIGHLNGERAVGRLDKVQLTNVKSSSENGKTRIKYHAVLPVAWGKKDRVPTAYILKLPIDMTSSAVTAFTEKYAHSCVDYGAHDVTSGSMWYYYRPNNSGCALAETDIVKTEAKVTVSAVGTTGKYPEYHRVWEDEVLQVVAIFGKYEDGATTTADAGISAYNSFVSVLKKKLTPYALVTEPAALPTTVGVGQPSITFEANLPDGKRVMVYVMLVDNIRTTSADFNTRYETLSQRADLIMYNGHAGLGANVRALAQKGDWVTGQYVIAFLNGCDSYTYIDSSLNDAHKAVNPTDDPDGIKYLDIINNAMPAFFSSMDDASLALVDGLMAYENPRTYEQIFKGFDSSQVVIVSGEQDNEFFPGFPGDGAVPDGAWAGLNESGTVVAEEEVRFETPSLAVGAYKFDTTGTGDADLYVRVGEAPTSDNYDCRPYRAGTKESCIIELTNAAPIHVMVRGYKAQSEFKLVGAKK